MAWGICLQYAANNAWPVGDPNSDLECAPLRLLTASERAPCSKTSSAVCSSKPVLRRSSRYCKSSLNIAHAAAPEFGRALAKRKHNAWRLSPRRWWCAAASKCLLSSSWLCNAAAASASACETQLSVGSSSAMPWPGSPRPDIGRSEVSLPSPDVWGEEDASAPQRLRKSALSEQGCPLCNLGMLW
eukprot:CAMPEP_0115233920 /NCGR_PEP_ID=MMETSP0270-20121206/34526_1 /TAXON_ID=71861 /ORGANISM="Scrippsiella trochoidea, Strain CCMP3099" /LENGTH=185 /DNA_ID=CAMNT_0002648651 /DNA_START=889 /DNA_END=1446 /DNA_ORIENTATION=-